MGRKPRQLTFFKQTLIWCWLPTLLPAHRQNPPHTPLELLYRTARHNTDATVRRKNFRQQRVRGTFPVPTFPIHSIWQNPLFHSLLCLGVLRGYEGESQSRSTSEQKQPNSRNNGSKWGVWCFVNMFCVQPTIRRFKHYATVVLFSVNTQRHRGES